MVGVEVVVGVGTVVGGGFVVEVGNMVGVGLELACQPELHQEDAVRKYKLFCKSADICYCK